MKIPTIPFGRLGHLSSRLIFGGFALSEASPQEAGRALDLLLEYGLNHLDVAAGYGEAELRIAPWLKRHPGHFFVATKTGSRTAQGAREDLQRSLERLGVDRVDLWQLHNLADPIEWDAALSPGGALDAAVEAKAQGLVGGIGVTGHGLQIAATHRRSLERFDFDSVLLPCNYITLQNAYYAANFEALMQTCRRQNIAVQTIKSISFQPALGRPLPYNTWYQPLQDQADIDAAVWWVLSRPGVFLITVGDLELLPRVLDAASRFDPEEMSASVAEQHLSRLDFVPLFV